MKHIDDNTLAAYLEGTLPDSDRKWVEQAIEEDDESKAVVDEWIALANNFMPHKHQENNNASRMEACQSIGAVMDQIKDTRDVYRRAAGAEYAAMPAMKKSRTYSTPARPKKHTLRNILVAASVLVFVSVTAIWLLHSPADVSAPSFDFPMGGNYMTSSPNEDSFVVDSNISFNDFSNQFK